MKTNRWRGGLKSGNRREKDMTRGTFNSGFEVQSDYVVNPFGSDLHRDLQWKIDLKANEGDTSGKLYFDRMEPQGFTERSSIGDSVHSDSYYLELDVGQYNVRGSTQETISAVRRLNSGNNGIALGSYKGRTALAVDNERQLFKAYPYGSIMFSNVDKDPSLFDYEWVTTFTGLLDQGVDTPVILETISVWTQTADVPYRVTFSYEDTGQILYNTCSLYELEHELRNKTSVGKTTLVFPDFLPLDANRNVVAEVIFKSPVLVAYNDLDFKRYFELSGRRLRVSVLEPTGVFITDIESLDAELEVETTRRSSPDDQEILEYSTGAENLRVYVEWDRGQLYQDFVLINDLPLMDITRVDSMTYTGYVDIVNSSPGIYVTKNGIKHLLPFTAPEVPQIFTATLSVIYPGTQTELKAGDIVDITVTTSMPVTRIDFVSGLAEGTHLTFPATTAFTVPLEVTNTSTSLQDLTQRITVTALARSIEVDTTNSMLHNNTYPQITVGTITYPVGQEALKDSESALVENTIIDFDEVLYTSTQLSVVDPTVYGTKSVSRISGDYNITDNLTIAATRTANDAVTQEQAAVKIAHLAPEIHITKPNHLRSGGSNGTSPQDHLVTVQSNQQMLNTVSLTAPEGTWQGSWVWNIDNFTRYLRVLDTDDKGSFNFSGLSVTNLAGRVVTTATGLNYNLQGFVSRDFEIPAFDYIASANLVPEVVSVVNLVADWSYKEGITYESTSNRPQIDKYTIMPSGEIRLLDQSATESSATATTFTIEEL